MKAVAAGAVLFGAAMGGLIYVNSNGSQHSWLAAGALYILTLLLVQFLQPMRTSSLKVFVRFNVAIATTVSVLILLDTLLLHRGIFKDIERFGSGFGFRVLVLVLGVGVPTALLGSVLGLGIMRVSRHFCPTD